MLERSYIRQLCNPWDLPPGEPDKCPPESWSGSVTFGASSRWFKPLKPENKRKWPFFSSRYHCCTFFVVSETMLASANVLAKAVNSIQEVELTKCSLTIYQVPIRNKYFQQEKQRLIEPKRCKSKGLSNPITGHLPLLCNGRVNNPSKAFARRQWSLHGSTGTCRQRD